MKVSELKQLRLDKRLTQQEVAQKMKVSQSYFSAIETGRRPTEVFEAAKIIGRMRARTDRTAGGEHKAGREK